MSNRAMNWSAMLWTNKCDGWSRPWSLYIFKKGTNKYFQITFNNSILSMQTAIHPKKVIIMLIWNELLLRKYFQFCNEVWIACPKTIQIWCCPFLATKIFFPKRQLFTWGGVRMNILKTATARTKSEKDAQTSCKTLHFDDNFSWTVQNAKLSSEKEPFF